MPRSRFQRWLLVHLGVFALIGQLLLPAVHAQTMAVRSGDPLLAAFCGEVAPQRLQALQQQLAASLQADAAKSDHPLKAGCPLCAGLHAASLAAPPAPAFAFAVLARHETPAVPARPAASHAQLRLPPQQAPPLFS